MWTKTKPILVLAALATFPVARAGELSLGSYSGPRLTLLAIDDQALPLREDLCYYLTRPQVRQEPVLSPSRGDPNAPDSVAAHFYGTVLHDEGKFRMWYYSVSWMQDPQKKENPQLREGPICYAESDDGLHWVKPHLGQVEFHGSRENNAIALPDHLTDGVFVIKDPEDADAARRYKMVYEMSRPPGNTLSFRTATSPDGIRWTAGDQAPSSDVMEPSSFYRFNGLYCVGAQYLQARSEGGHQAGRQGYVWISTDFRHWLPQVSESFLLPEPADPSARGGDCRYTQVHLGVGGAPFGNVAVGLYCQWHAEPQAGDWFGNGKTFGDLGLLVSDDGQHFREVVEGAVYLDRRASRPAVPPRVRWEEILVQANGILNVGNETRIYHGRWTNAEKDDDYSGEIALATIPRDRWGALGLNADASSGSVWTAPLSWDGAGCSLTANAEGISGMTVEIADEHFHLLPEFSGENAGRCAGGDGLDSAVAWKAGGLERLAGRKIRFLVHLSQGTGANPRLYALYASSGPPSP